MVSPADLAQCRQMIRDGSKTFYTASLLLPQRVCDAARSLYAFCRVADDLVDRSQDSRAAVDQLLARLDRIYRGQPDKSRPTAPSRMSPRALPSRAKSPRR